MGESRRHHPWWIGPCLGVAAACGDAGTNVASVEAAVVAAPLEESLAWRPFQRAVHLRAAGEHALAARKLERAIELDPAQPAPHYLLGRTRLALANVRLGYATVEHPRVDEALESFERAIGLAPESPEYRFWAGVALELRGDWDRAVTRFGEVVARDPAHAEGHRRLASLLFRLGRTGEACEHFERSLAIEPGRADSLYGLGLALEAARDPRAMDVFEEAVVVDPTHEGAHFRLSQRFARSGEARASAWHHRQYERWLGLRRNLTNRERAAEARPNDPRCLALLGAAHVLLLEHEAALPWLERALRLDPNEPTAHLFLGRVRLERGELESAARHLHRAEELEPRNPEVHRHLALLEADEGRMEAAWARMVQVARESEHVPTLLDAARLADRAGRPAEARALYERLLALRPDEAEAHLGLALLLERQEANAAAAAYREVLALVPRHPGARDALARLEGR